MCSSVIAIAKMIVASLSTKPPRHDNKWEKLKIENREVLASTRYSQLCWHWLKVMFLQLQLVPLLQNGKFNWPLQNYYFAVNITPRLPSYFLKNLFNLFLAWIFVKNDTFSLGLLIVCNRNTTTTGTGGHFPFSSS